MYTYVCCIAVKAMFVFANLSISPTSKRNRIKNYTTFMYLSGNYFDLFLPHSLVIKFGKSFDFNLYLVV